MISSRPITRHYWLHVDGDIDERVIHLYEHCFIHQLDRFLAEHYPMPPYPASYVGGESFLHYIYLTVDCCTDIVPAPHPKETSVAILFTRFRCID